MEAVFLPLPAQSYAGDTVPRGGVGRAGDAGVLRAAVCVPVHGVVPGGKSSGTGGNHHLCVASADVFPRIADERHGADTSGDDGRVGVCGASPGRSVSLRVRAEHGAAACECADAACADDCAAIPAADRVADAAAGKPARADAGIRIAAHRRDEPVRDCGHFRRYPDADDGQPRHQRHHHLHQQRFRGQHHPPDALPGQRAGDHPLSAVRAVA